ncbi:MAG: hypothetical protein ACKVWV_06385 [Planctomycetota bacterium]
MAARTRACSSATAAPPFVADSTSPAESPRVLAGVDEAGLGPLLGPLTIGFAAFAVPPGLDDLWRALASAVCREPGRDGQRLVVADSKLVFTRNPRGERRLESTALAFLALAHPAQRPPRSGAELARAALGLERDHDDFLRQPWSPHLPTALPRAAQPSALEEHIRALSAALARADVELVGIGARALAPDALNASFERTQNKARTHWDTSAPVLRHLWDRHAARGLAVLVDRHGGRMRYAPFLREAFPEATVAIQAEAPARSEYLVSSQSRTMRIAFAEKADRGSFAVALASCLAKYVRETCMHAFNAYFERISPGLRPTAGYTTDGWRWLRDAEGAIERSGIPRSALVRSR